MNDNSISGGVVTFLDVLGWKGVYDRKNDAINSLRRLVEGLELRVEKCSRGLIVGNVEVKSISDTIALFTFCTESEISKAIEVHGRLCKWVIPESIRSEIPVRGATSYGTFEIHGNIFVGKAVDEAASWHEYADWIGVHLTPSAEFVYTPSEKATAWKRYSPPNKNRLSWDTHCVDWTASWNNHAEEIKDIKNKFRNLGPIVPEIAAKFTNTLKFISTRNQE